MTKRPGADRRLPAVREPETGHNKREAGQGLAPPAPREAGREGRLAGVVEARPEGLPAKRRPGRGGTTAHGTHGRAGDTGPNVGGRARPARPGAPHRSPRDFNGWPSRHVSTPPGRAGRGPT